MQTTKIEWTQNPDGTSGKTWNPVVGCTKVSPGCDHCYAETIAERFRGQPAFPTGFDLTLRPDRLEQPIHVRKPTTFFVNSVSDLFHVDVPALYIEQVWETMARCKRHQFLILTKRAERMERVVLPLHSSFDDELERFVSHPLPNVWLGVSVESPKYYGRIRHLARTPAAVRFLSCEPLLEALPDLPLDGVDWVIIGGESGAGARPLQLDWIRDIVAQCRRSGAAPFVKQLGSVWAREHGIRNKGGGIDDWPEDLRIREMPGAHQLAAAL